MHEVFGRRKILDRKCVYFLISLIKSISPNDDDEICCSYRTLVTSFCLTISFWTFHSESRWKLWSISGNKCSNSLRIPRLWHQKVLPQDFVWEEEKEATGKVSNINRLIKRLKILAFWKTWRIYLTDLFVNKVNYFKHCENPGSTIALAYHSDILVQKG